MRRGNLIWNNKSKRKYNSAFIGFARYPFISEDGAKPVKAELLL